MDRKVKMPLVGPFELTEEEFLGLKILWQEDEKQLSNKNLHAARFGDLTIAKRSDSAEVPALIQPVQPSILCGDEPSLRLRSRERAYREEPEAPCVKLRADSHDRRILS